LEAVRSGVSRASAELGYRSRRRRGASGSAGLALVVLVLMVAPATSPGAWAQGATHPPGASPGAALDHRMACREPECPASVAPGGRGSTASATAGGLASPSFAVNYSAASVLVSDPVHTTDLWAFGTDEAAAVGVNTTSPKAFPNGTVTSFTSTDQGHRWTAALLPGSPWYTESWSALCGFENDGAIAAAAFNGSIALLVSAVPSASPSGCEDTPTGWALWLFVSPNAGATWNAPSLLVLAPRAPTQGAVAHPADVAIGRANGTIYVSYPDIANNTTVLRAVAQDGRVVLGSVTLLPTTAEGTRLAVSEQGVVEALTWYETVAASPADHFVGQFQVDLLSLPGAFSGGVPTITNATVGTFEAFSLGGFPVADLAADVGPDSPFQGRLYASWPNGTNLSGGSPTIALSDSDNGGVSWSSPVNVSGSESAYDCCADAAVGGNGAVVVGWYGFTGSTNPLYRFSASVSFDGGEEFSPEFGADGWTGNGTNEIGAPGLAAEGNSIEAVWTQYRSATPVACPACPGGVAPDREMDAATIVVGSIASTSAVNLSTSGIPTAGNTLSAGPLPVPVAGVAGQSLTVTAPLSFVDGGATLYFSEWFGSNYSLAPGLTLEWAIGLNLTACFVASQGAPCHAAGAPGTLAVDVSPLDATVAADGQRVQLNFGLGSIALPAGLQAVTVTAAGFVTSSSEVLITPGNTTQLNISLAPQLAIFEGSVSPAGARVTVDGAGIPIATNGNFSVNLTSGSYVVAADEYGYADYSSTVVVSYLAPTALDIVLIEEPSRILGIVTPANATLRVDGMLISQESTGAFSLNLSAGQHVFTAKSWRYLPYSLTVELEPSQYVPLGIHLTPANGTLHAIVSPASAAVELDGIRAVTTNGTLEMNVPWGSHYLSASESGFSPEQTVLTVPYGAIVNATLRLSTAPGWISGNVTPTNATVSVDGAELTVSANGSFNQSMAAGPYSLNVSAPGYVGRTFELVVAPGESDRITVSLVPSPLAPSGNMTTRPLSASVLADGLELDAAILVGVAVLFGIAQRRPRAD
jgi:hypothetical protein